MGWGSMFLLGNIGQQMDIEDQKSELERLREQFISHTHEPDNSVEARIARLEKENGELKLYLAALIRYLEHKGTVRESEFRNLVNVIDSEDGTTDGGYSGDIIR